MHQRDLPSPLDPAFSSPSSSGRHWISSTDHTPICRSESALLNRFPASIGSSSGNLLTPAQAASKSSKFFKSAQPLPRFSSFASPASPYQPSGGSLLDSHQRIKLRAYREYGMSTPPAAPQETSPRIVVPGGPRFIVAIAENNAREVGMAALQLDSAEVLITQIADSSLYSTALTLIYGFAPLQVFISSTLIDTSLLVRKIQRELEIGVTPMQRHCFNQSNGAQIYQGAKKRSEVPDIEKKYLALQALSAVQKAAELKHSCMFILECLLIEYFQFQKFMRLDYGTLMQLEVVLTKKGTIQGSLASLFNTITRGGGYLIRSQLIHPLADAEELKARYAAVNELIQGHQEVLRKGLTESRLENIRKILKQFKQIDSCVGSFAKKEIWNAEPSDQQIKSRILNLLRLKNFLKLVPQLAKFVGGAGLLGRVQELLDLPRLRSINLQIDRVIDPTKTGDILAFQKTKSVFFCIQQNIADFLDVARDAYRETNDTAHKWAQRHGVKLEVSETRGFFISFQKTDYEKLIQDLRAEGDALVEVKQGRRCTGTTRQFLTLSNRIKELRRDIYFHSNKAIHGVNTKIAKNIQPLFRLTSAVANLDMIQAFVGFALSSSHVHSCPQIIEPNQDEESKENGSYEQVYISIEQGRQPMLRDAKATSLKASNFQNLNFVLGANGSGKTTLLRMVALNVLLAQIGSFVPAKRLVFTPFSGLFAKLGFSDSVEQGMGTYLSELKDMALLNQNLLKKSLVLVDELGSSTAHTASVPVSRAYSEFFLIALHCIVFFATHNHQLVRSLSNDHTSVRHLFMGDDSFKFDYQVKSDGKLRPLYGVRMAETLALPEAFFKEAKRFASMLEEANEEEETRLSSLGRLGLQEIFLKKQKAISQFQKIL